MIDTKNFNFRQSRYQDIYLHLKNKGFEVYAPNTKTGEATSKYVIVKENGQSKINDISSSEVSYNIFCYVPQHKYSELAPFVTQVEEAMIELEPMVTNTHYHSASYYEDELKAHYIYMEFKNNKFNLRRI